MANNLAISLGALCLTGCVPLEIRNYYPRPYIKPVIVERFHQPYYYIDGYGWCWNNRLGKHWHYYGR